jgi:hypothetical protein
VVFYAPRVTAGQWAAALAAAAAFHAGATEVGVALWPSLATLAARDPGALGTARGEAAAAVAARALTLPGAGGDVMQAGAKLAAALLQAASAADAALVTTLVHASLAALAAGRGDPEERAPGPALATVMLSL